MKDALDKNFKNLLQREEPMLPYGTAVSLRFEVGYYIKRSKVWTVHALTTRPNSSKAMSHGLVK